MKHVSSAGSLCARSPGHKETEDVVAVGWAGNGSTADTSTGSDSARQAGSLRPGSPWMSCQLESELSSLVGRA